MPLWKLIRKAKWNQLKKRFDKDIEFPSGKPAQVLNSVFTNYQELIIQSKEIENELKKLQKSHQFIRNDLLPLVQFKGNYPQAAITQEESMTDLLSKIKKVLEKNRDGLEKNNVNQQLYENILNKLTPYKEELFDSENEIDLPAIVDALITKWKDGKSFKSHVFNLGIESVEGDTEEERVLRSIQQAVTVHNDYKKLTQEISNSLNEGPFSDLQNEAIDKEGIIDLERLVTELLSKYRVHQELSLQIKKLSAQYELDYPQLTEDAQLEKLAALIQPLSPKPSHLIEDAIIEKAKTEIRNFSSAYEEDHERSKEAKKEFKRWKGYIVHLLNQYQNKLLYNLSQVFKDNKYDIVDPSKVLLLGLENRDENNSDRIHDLKSMLDNIKEEDKLSDVLQQSSYTNIRGKYDIDFLFKSDNEKLTNETILFLKQKLTNLLLWYKILLKDRDKLIKLAVSLTGKEEMFHSPLIDMDDRVREQVAKTVLYGSQAPMPEMPLNSIFDEADNWLKENFRRSNEMRDAAESVKKGYVRLLSTGIFRVGGEILIARDNVVNSITNLASADQEYVRNWTQIYQDFYDIIMQFLREVLHIIPLEVERGQPYQYLLHKPVDQAEPDSEYKDDDIKEVFNDGFRLMHPESIVEEDVAEIMTIEKMLDVAQEAILHQAGVILVKN